MDGRNGALIEGWIDIRFDGQTGRQTENATIIFGNSLIILLPL
jgi:hypothetical protein